jgi:Leucine-rich repeat (LRR) protein
MRVGKGKASGGSDKGSGQEDTC